MIRAVKAADNGLADARNFYGILGVDQTFSQSGQLGAAEFSLGIELIDEAHDTGLLFRREPFDLVNDLRRSHSTRLIRVFEILKFCRALLRAESAELICAGFGNRSAV